MKVKLSPFFRKEYLLTYIIKGSRDDQFFNHIHYFFCYRIGLALKILFTRVYVD